MILSQSPTVEPAGSEPAARPLAYEQAISQPPKPKAAPEEDTASKTAISPFETVTIELQPQPAEAGEQSAALNSPVDGTDMAALPGEGADPSDGNPAWPGEGANASQDSAALPGESADPYGAMPPLPGEAGPGPQQWGTDGAEQWGDEGGEQGGNEGADQWDDQGATQWADENTEEWVEVVISGAAMRATAAEDAPMLFAFPYGRNLRVVSRYEGWVEVTDPKSAATGWMQAHYLAPSAAARRQPYGQNEAYYDEPRGRRQGGWFRRNGGLADMINRALGGGF